MKHNRNLVPDYFVSLLPGVWRVTHDGEAIHWHDIDKTALMLKHLQAVAIPLSKELGGLPSLTAVLFIVDALSKGWTRELAEARVSKLLQAAALSKQANDLNQELVGWLVSLAEMPEEFRHGVHAHTAVLCELLEHLPAAQLVTRSAQTELALQWLENATGQRNSISDFRISVPATIDVATKTIETLDYAAMKGLDAESLRLRIETGLDQLPVPPDNPFELPDPHPFASLLRKLQEGADPHLREAARLAWLASSTLSLPRQPTQHDILPIGGVSDVTNKGQPDRLLMSELAADPDLLIARIANHQALYLRREYPPAPQATQRRMLIESGIRTWGNPRLFLSALAMGLCASEERRRGAPLSIITIAGQEHWVEDFHTQAGLVAYFQRLNTSLHPGAILEKLIHEWSEQSEPLAEPILVLCAASYRDSEFQCSLARMPTPYLVAIVEQNGSVEIRRHSASGQNVLQRCDLREQSAVAIRHQPALPVRWPRFVDLKPCPLRFAVDMPGRFVQAFGSKEDAVIWTVTHDHQIMRFGEKMCGAVQVGNLPKGDILACQVFEKDTWRLIIQRWTKGSRQPEHLLVRANIDGTVRVITLDLEGEHHAHVTYAFDRSDLLRAGNRIVFLDRDSGQILGSTSRVYSHLGGAFFGANDLFVANRKQSKIEMLSLAKCSNLLGFVARANDGHPVLYSYDLSWMKLLHSSHTPPQSTNLHIQSYQRPVLERVHANGNSALVRVRGVQVCSDQRLVGDVKSSHYVRVSLTEPKAEYFGPSTQATVSQFELSELNYVFPAYLIHRRFTHIGFSRGRIVLRKTRYDMAITFSEQYRPKFVLNKRERWNEPLALFGKPFAYERDGVKSRWHLRHASLPSGDAWLDSRGLLHLRSSVDDSELTLVLNEECGGWHSSGATFGNFFTKAQPLSPPQHVIDWFEEFTYQQC